MARDPNPADELRDLVGAQGKLLTFLVAMLERRGIVGSGEFASLLGAFAETVAESDPGEGRVLEAWTAAVRASARH